MDRSSTPGSSPRVGALLAQMTSPVPGSQWTTFCGAGYAAVAVLALTWLGADMKRINHFRGAKRYLAWALIGLVIGAFSLWWITNSNQISPCTSWLSSA